MYKNIWFVRNKLKIHFQKAIFALPFVKNAMKKKQEKNEIIHQSMGVDGWQEIYVEAPSEEDIRKEVAEENRKGNNASKNRLENPAGGNI